MPTWSHQLPKVAPHQGYDLKRTPTSATLSAICTCDDIVVCDTHFWRGRTTPCERQVNDDGKTIDDSTCDACLNKSAWRTKVYVSAFNLKTSEHFLYECSANAAKAFVDYRLGNTTLRGCGFHANRPKCIPNGKVTISTQTVNQAKHHLPQAPDLPRALSIIWRLPTTAVAVVQQKWGDPTVAIDPEPLAAMRNQPDDAGGEIAFVQRREELITDFLAAASNGNGKPKKAKV